MDAPMFLTPLVQGAAGLALLFAGQRLFWLFVAVVGFFLGAEFARLGLNGWDDLTVVALAVVAGVVGAGLAVLLQRFAVILAGALAGGLLAVRMAPLLNLHTDAGVLVAFIVGALLSAVALAVLFDPALIVVSSLVGAVMLTEALPLDRLLAPFLLVALAVVGGVFQTRRLMAWRRASAP